MSNYTPISDFTAKDALATGNPSKIILGSEVDAEFDAIATAVATKVDAFNSLPAETTVASADVLAFYDDNAGSHKKITQANFRTDLNAGWVWLETETASNSPTLDFTLPSTYDNFLLELVNIKPATDGTNLDVTLSSDDVTYFSASYAWTNDRLNTATTVTPEGSASDSSIQLMSNIGNQDGEQLVGTAHVTSISGMGTRLHWAVNAVTASSVFVQVTGAGMYAGAAARYLRLVAASGNITAGTARLYGLKKT